MSDDAELLRRYAARSAEADFAEFVRRHIDFVYGCAVRRLGGDVHLAEDVVQQVFTAAARQARALADHPVPTGWLFAATRNTAAQVVRTERRRRAREEAAMALEIQESAGNGPVPWEQLRPVIDEALDGLSESDRQAVLLRFFEGKTFAEVGVRLRLAENTARMRVERALDKLAKALARRGVRSTGAALAIGLANQVGIAAPAGLATATTAAAIAGNGAAATFLMGITKLQIGMASAALVVGGVGFVAQHRELVALRDELARGQRQLGEGAAIEAQHRELEAAIAEQTQKVAAANAELGQLRERIAASSGVRAKPVAAGILSSSGVQPRVVRSIAGEVFDLKSVDQIPKATSQLAPRYPRDLRAAGIQGEATIDFVVDADGGVQDAHVIQSSHPAIGDAALEAVRRWTFEPGRKQGKAVPTHMQVPVVFMTGEEAEALQDKSPDSPPMVPWF